MEQGKIWRYFQSVHPESFSGAAPRLSHLVDRLPRASVVVNIGVGSGQFERLAQARGHQVISIDPDALSLHSAHQESHGIAACAGRIQAIPLAKSCVDAVVASEVLEHLGDEVLFSGLAEIRRVLKPGGIFLGTVPFEEDLLASEVVCPCCGAVFHKVGHVRSFGFQSMAKVLATQFERSVLRRIAFMNTTDLRLWKRVFASVRNLLVQHGILTRETSLVFEAHKPVRP